MYNKFFGFKEKPFKLVPNPEYLFLSKSHEEALAHLTYAISQGDGFVEITGEVGTGKTTLCRVFLENLDKSIEAAYIFNPKLDALQLLKAINDEFNIDSTPDNTKDLIDRLNDFLIEKKGGGQKVLVLIDEAQNLSLEVLEQLRLLSNLETTQEKLLQIILVGQPELGDMLSSHQLRQLGQRITINCRLSPLTFEETKDYIRHRIALASHRAGPPFDRGAYRAIYEYSRGIPRLINIGCDRALLNAFSRNSFKISGSIVKEAIRELTRKKTGSSYSWLLGPSGFAIAAVIFVPIVILLLYLAIEKSPEAPAISTVSPPAQVSQLPLQQAVPEVEQVVKASVSEEKPNTPQAEEPTAIKGEDLLPGQQEEFVNNIDPLTSAELIELTTDKNKIPVVPMPAGHENESIKNITEQQDKPDLAVKQSQISETTKNFLDYLKGLNSRYSRNNSMEGILKLWFPVENISLEQKIIDSDRFFFQESARQFDLQLQPLATEPDLALIQTLNLPTIFTFYLAGHSWPKYLAVSSIDEEKIYFSEDKQSPMVSVDRDVFLKFWSGEVYVFWKNFNKLNEVITQHSKGPEVISLKRLLQQLGYSDVIMTDTYDKDTRQIIKAIQAKYGLYMDGLVGPLTKIAMYNESREFIKPSLVKFEAARTENGS